MTEYEARLLLKSHEETRQANEKIKCLEGELAKLKSDRWVKFDREEHEEALLSGESIRARVIKNGTDGYAYYTRNYCNILPTLKEAKKEAIECISLEDA